jgi:hypothetical protein
MPALIQICIVIVTVGMVMIAIAAVRTMARVDKAADSGAGAAQDPDAVKRSVEEAVR